MFSIKEKTNKLKKLIVPDKVDAEISKVSSTTVTLIKRVQSITTGQCREELFCATFHIE